MPNAPIALRPKPESGSSSYGLRLLRPQPEKPIGALNNLRWSCEAQTGELPRLRSSCGRGDFVERDSSSLQGRLALVWPVPGELTNLAYS